MLNRAAWGEASFIRTDWAKKALGVFSKCLVLTIHLELVHVDFLQVEFSFTVSQKDHHVFAQPQAGIRAESSGQVGFELTLQRRRRRLEERVRIPPQEVRGEVQRRRETPATGERDRWHLHLLDVVLSVVGGRGRDGLQDGGQALGSLERVQRRRRRRRRRGRTLRRKLHQVGPVGIVHLQEKRKTISLTHYRLINWTTWA